MLRAGFTGTRHGLSDAQRLRLGDGLRRLAPSELHHGCCLGADESAAVIASVHLAGCWVVAHPPENTSLLSEAALRVSDERRDPLPYLERDAAIVDACDVLIACPRGMVEERSSGTWATVRMARRAGKRIVIVWPDGSVTRENGA
jgi:hypothetical protein